ncbi:hypothetical protein [Imtechella halotolerans]|nr:hypothetical protein [Imtechella halotolerans]WMQ64699.1 hypothetical protein PT603_06865 [Imtechella halotolerans]
MDQLLYKYPQDKPNQFLRVEDVVTAIISSEDIKSQPWNNYM